jgi:hypothetical protein
LRAPTRTADDAKAAKILAGALVKICSAEGATRHQILDVLDRMRDQRVDVSSPRTAPAVDALRDAMLAAVNRMPDGPPD